MIIFSPLILISFSNEDKNNNTTPETNVKLLTGISIISFKFTAIIQLGNPNILNNNPFITYRKPPAGIKLLTF